MTVSAADAGMPPPFEKQHGPRVLQDYKRAQALYAASLRAHTFAAPEPLDTDTRRGVIRYSQLPEGEPLGNMVFAAILGRGTNAHLGTDLERTGAALAELHVLLDPVTPRQIEFAPETVRGIGEALRRDCELKLAALPIHGLHGDFAACNVWLGRDGRLFLIDPLPRQALCDEDAGTASISFDVAQMIGSLALSWDRPRLLLKGDWDEIERLVERFLCGYEAEAALALPRRAIRIAALGLFDRYWADVFARPSPPIRRTIQRTVIASRRRAFLRKTLAG